MPDRKVKPPDFVSSQVESGRYLFLDLEVETQRNLILNCAGREECRPDFDLVRAGFDYCAVEYIQTGQWELETEQGIQTIGPGAVFSYEPDTRFQLRSAGEEVQAKYFVDFSGKQAEQALAESGLQPGKSLVVYPQRWIQEIFDQILDTSRYSKRRAQEVSSLLTHVLLQRIGADSRQWAEPRQESYETYQRCMNYLREHFLELKTMKELSDACHLDRAYLSRLFKQYGEESPYQLLVRYKMEHAAGLLRYRKLSVKATAKEAGFDDPYHFSRVFKNHFGMSPRHFAQGTRLH